MIRNSQKKSRSFFILAIICLFSLSAPSFALAQTASTTDAAVPAADPNRYSETEIINAVPAGSFELTAFEGGFGISFVRDASIRYGSAKLSEINEPAGLAWQLEKISKIYQFEITDGTGKAVAGRYKLRLNYKKNSNGLKSVFYFDKKAALWKKLPSSDDAAKNMITADVSLGYARVAVFQNEGILTVGKASWYSHRGGLFAASPDYPKGARLKVVNLENSKSVIVEINDFGPDRSLHPDRVIDLDKVAFKKIARTGQGTIRVRIVPLDAKIKAAQMFLADRYSTNIVTRAKSALVIDSKTGGILYTKNASSSLPIASLTKIVAAKVFLDTRPSLDRVVSYSVADEEKNYKYANKWEIARLRLGDGDTLTISDLLYSALLGSANNAVESLVRVSGLERGDFIGRMNAYASAVGATATSFEEPTGLSPKNVSSASDYAIMTSRILEHPIMEKVSKMRSYTFYTINTKKRHYITNSNSLITVGNLKITGSKTGYLDEAGYCLMTKARSSDGDEIIAVTLGSPDKASSFNETKNLLYYGFRQIN